MTTKLEDILDKIDKNDLILPDFQREFVWIDEDKVEGFISSVLAQIPLGSIISFHQNFDTFANKEIGFQENITNVNNDKKVEFLLDGQQRLTTLSLCFSDRIFNKIRLNSEKKLLKPEMKRRYFLKLPRYDEIDKKDDFFGFLNLMFPSKSTDRVEFCSDEVIDLIECRIFTYATNDRKKCWYYPNYYRSSIKELKAAEDIEFINCAVSNGLIPLYLLVDNTALLKRIIQKFAKSRQEFLADTFTLQHGDELREYILKHPYFKQKISIEDTQTMLNEFQTELDSLSGLWADNMFDYLKACMNLKLNVIDVEDDSAARAINIYEALNTGGAKLSTFDLIVAKAAQTQQNDGNSSTYSQRMKQIVLAYKNPLLLELLSNDRLSDWNVSTYLNGYNKDKISPVIITQFLNILCILSNLTNDGKPSDAINKFSPIYCREKEQLKLKSNDIWKFSEFAMKAVCDALMFMQFRLGIYDMNQINYDLSIIPIAYSMYLIQEEHMDIIAIHRTFNKIEAWYWYTIFTGGYNTDQSTNVIEHTKQLHYWIINGQAPMDFDPSNIDAKLSRVLNIENYNDKPMLFNNDITLAAPKKGCKDSLLQFSLAEIPSDFIKDDNGCSVPLYAWMIGEKLNLPKPEKFSFEAHHMIPLGTATKIKESTKSIRKSRFLINSPLNLTNISSVANSTILARSINEYCTELPDDFLACYHFDSEIKSFRYNPTDSTSDNKLEKILSKRYEYLQSEIIKKIKDCIRQS